MTRESVARGRFAFVVSLLTVGVLASAFASPAHAAGNPDKGKALFAQNCAACHGASGKGDGAAAAALNPKPRDLTDKAYMTSLKDEQIFAVVQKGGSAVGKSPGMPPFGAAMKDGDINDVIAFIRSLSK